MPLKTGDQAPNFKLYSSDKTEVSLSDYKGKNVVLLFFPAAFTGGCTKELCGIRDTMNVYNSLNTDVLAISVDAVYTLGKFKEDQSFNFPLLSDFNKETITAYDCKYDHWNFDMKGVAKRSAFVVDKDGIIRHSEILENAGDQPDFEAVNSVLNTLN